jgi:hypothetical protein
LPQCFVLDQNGLNEKIRRVRYRLDRFANHLGGFAILLNWSKPANAREEIRDHLPFCRGH